MQVIDEELDISKNDSYSLISKYYPGKKFMMFDIETTGLSPLRSFIYLIGVNIFKNGRWHIIQYFNDDGRSESEIIQIFEDLITSYDILIEFNGDTFDIPFVSKRIEQIKLHTGKIISNNFNKISTIDLMKKIRPYKYALGLPNIKQKTIEKYLEIYREDKFNGGQLIDVYLNFLSSHSEKEKSLVLMHNRDDMEGMLFLTPIFNIDAISEGLFNNITVSTKTKNNSLYFFTGCILSEPVPEKIIASMIGIDLTACDDKLCLTVPIYHTSLRPFPYTSAPACTKIEYDLHESLFIPDSNCKNREILHYKESRKSKYSYIELTDEFLGSTSALHNYIQEISSEILHNKIILK